MLISPVKEIEAIHVVPYKSGLVRKAKAFACINGVTVCHIKDRVIWTNWSQLTRYALLPGNWSGMTLSFIKCLVKLGLVEKKHLDAHMAHVRKCEQRSQRKHDRETILAINNRYGTKIRVPKLLEQ